MEEKKKSPRRVRLTTMQIVALGFFGVIFLGGVLLWLPFSNQKPIEFIDALRLAGYAQYYGKAQRVAASEQSTFSSNITETAPSR